MLRYVEIDGDMLRYANICQYVRICQDMSRYVRICSIFSDMFRFV